MNSGVLAPTKSRTRPPPTAADFRPAVEASLATSGLEKLPCWSRTAPYFTS